MGRYKLYESDADRRKAQTARRSRTSVMRLPRFVGVDGEADTSNGHIYCLLSVGSHHLATPGKALTFPDVASFLYSRFLADPDCVYGGYFLAYDFTMWLRSLPADRAWMLLSDKGKQLRARSRSNANRTPFPVRYAGWEFDMLGFKRFKLRPQGSKKGWMYINDCGSYFQTSLLAATDPDRWSEPILSADEYATLRRGKERRSNAALDDDMLAYNALENDVFARLMGVLAQGLSDCGVHLRRNQWYGPGQAAQAWLNNLATVPDRESLSEHIPAHVLELGRLTYYGGWFEIFAHGHIPGTTYEYDINSAYPYIIAGLPCLLHGSWHLGNTLDDSRLSIVHARVKGSDRHIGAMLHRMPDGNIRRPSYTEGYYWTAEILAAKTANLIDTVTVLESWSYEPCDCKPPLRSVAGLYDQRLAVGKDTPMGKALRLLLNSFYGKFAQSVGDPRYGNALYASLITSGCRTMILDAIASHPLRSDGVVMIATDGVYFTEPHPTLPISRKLGDWDVSTKQNLTLFKPGVYWDDSTRNGLYRGNGVQFKARGINAGAFSTALADIDAAFAKWSRFPRERDPMGSRVGWYPRVTFTTSFAIVSAQQALAWGHWERCGSTGHSDTHPSGCHGCSGAHLVQDSDPIGKRHSGYLDGGRHIFWSEPYPDGGPQRHSAAYDRRFGQPDPEEYGITDDGTVLDTMARVMVG